MKTVRLIAVNMLLMLLMLALVACNTTGSNPATARDITPPEGLVGVDWQLLSFETVGGEAEPVSGEGLYTLKVQEDSTAIGIADCNLYGSHVSFDGQHLEFEEIASTLALCPASSKSTEFLNALEAARTYEIREFNLRIYYNNGANALNFAPYQP